MSKYYLMHYSSPYYDPQKAHEYYMQNRKLKGRASTSGLNEEGRKVAQYVKNQLNDERKTKVEQHSANTSRQIETLRDQKALDLESYKNETQTKIMTLQNKIQRMTKAERDKAADKLYAEIESLREMNAAKREELNSAFKTNSDSLRTNLKQTRDDLKTEYDVKYENELDRIKSESRYRKPARVSKTKK